MGGIWVLHRPNPTVRHRTDGLTGWAETLIKKTSSLNSKFMQPKRGPPMLYTVALILVILWLLGLVTSYTLGGFIHILIVIAVIVVLLRIISGRKVL